MRIAVDAHALGTGAGGNETFVRAVLHGLRLASPDADILALVQEPGCEEAGLTAGFPAHMLKYQNAWLRVPFALPRALREVKADLLHAQYIAPPICPCPFVVTLHDMVWKRFPHTLPFLTRNRLAALVPGSLRRARRVFVVTEAMRREAMAIYGVPESRIDVVPNAVDPIFRPAAQEERAAIRTKYKLPDKFVLYVGAIHPRKNVARLARAVESLARRGLPHALVLVGKQGWGLRDTVEAISPLQRDGRLVVTDYVPIEDLPGLYSCADAFAYLSLYEGFGLPVVEAMACGTPVFISSDPALIEVSGGAASTCNPLEQDDIDAHLYQILTDEVLRSRLHREGPVQAARYTVEATGRAAWQGYLNAFQ